MVKFTRSPSKSVCWIHHWIFSTTQEEDLSEDMNEGMHACMLSCFSRVRPFVHQVPGPMDCSPPGSLVQGVHQARILEWVMTEWRNKQRARKGAHPHVTWHHEMPEVHETEVSFMTMQPSARLCACPGSANCDRPRPSAVRHTPKRISWEALKKLTHPLSQMVEAGVAKSSREWRRRPSSHPYPRSPDRATERA